MGFYEEISNYYDYIFPVKDAQLNFIKATAGKPSKQVLDVACGSGGYSIQLAKEGYHMTAIDLDEKMVIETKSKANSHEVQVNAKQGDMLTLEQNLTDIYDTIFCIGNSVAHLNSTADIGRFFKSSFNLLENEGSLVVQIINYDRVLDQGIKALPTVKNDKANLTFERKYEYDVNLNKILFITRLQVGDEVYNNTIPLLPIRSEQFIELIKEAGFKTVESYGDFNKTPYDQQDSYHLVVRATK